jgi:hypothetical protein
MLRRHNIGLAARPVVKSCFCAQPNAIHLQRTLFSILSSTYFLLP